MKYRDSQDTIVVYQRVDDAVVKPSETVVTIFTEKQELCCRESQNNVHCLIELI
jgi:hypothetical protein